MSQINPFSNRVLKLTNRVTKMLPLWSRRRDIRLSFWSHAAFHSHRTSSSSQQDAASKYGAPFGRHILQWELSSLAPRQSTLKSWVLKSKQATVQHVTQQQPVRPQTSVKVKLSLKCNLGFFCECIWVKPSCKSMITKKEALLRLTILTGTFTLASKSLFLER